MSVFGKHAPLALWIALTIASLSGCNNDAGAPAGNPQTAKPHTMQAVIPLIDVTMIQLGNALGADGKIGKPTAIFKPTDTVYVAATTERPGHNIALKAKWTFQDDTVVKEITQTISPTDTLVTHFQIANDSGWPTGRYKLEIQVNGQTAAVTEYTVNP